MNKTLSTALLWSAAGFVVGGWLVFWLIASGQNSTTHAVDQCIRQEQFKQCLVTAESSRFANGSTLAECGHQARALSIRNVLYIKPECQLSE